MGRRRTGYRGDRRSTRDGVVRVESAAEIEQVGLKRTKGPKGTCGQE